MSLQSPMEPPQAGSAYGGGGRRHAGAHKTPQRERGGGELGLAKLRRQSTRRLSPGVGAMRPGQGPARSGPARHFKAGRPSIGMAGYRPTPHGCD